MSINKNLVVKVRIPGYYWSEDFKLYEVGEKCVKTIELCDRNSSFNL